MLVIEVPRKASAPIRLMKGDSSIFVKLEHPENSPSGTFDLYGTFALWRLVQPENALSPISVTLLGIVPISLKEARFVEQAFAD